MGNRAASAVPRNALERHADLLAQLVLLLVSLSYLRLFDWSAAPAEDAAILMRYSQHLAAGHGIVWNVGGPPVDGATDFLFMVVVAGLERLGAGVEHAVRGLTLASHFLTVLLVYWANRRLWQASILPSFFSGLYLAACTGLAYAAAYFGTPFFALSATVTWILCLQLTKSDDQPPARLSIAFACSALVMGLIRPEGVLLAALMAISLVISRGWRRTRHILTTLGAAFLVFGGAYFAWRWWYFGYPLPNPYYKKGGGALHWDALYASLLGYSRFIRPFIPAFLLALWSPQSTKRMVVAAIPLVGFACAFVLVSNEMNYAGRFQYALLPMTLVAWAPLVAGIKLRAPATSPRQRIAWTVAAVAVAFACVRYATDQNCVFQARSLACGTGKVTNGLFAAGRMLSEYHDRGYVMAVSEAGLLPLYSGWTAIDTWGLNDPWIAHNGGVTASYLEQYKPHVIMFHAYFSPGAPPSPTPASLHDPWFRMTLTLRDYAEAHGYILAADFGSSPTDTHYFYVRRDFADSTRIVQQLESLKYGISQGFAANYARPAQ